MATTCVGMHPYAGPSGLMLVSADTARAHGIADSDCWLCWPCYAALFVPPPASETVATSSVATEVASVSKWDTLERSAA